MPAEETATHTRVLEYVGANAGLPSKRAFDCDEYLAIPPGGQKSATMAPLSDIIQ